MQFTAVIHIMPRAEILDPQGKATLMGLKNLGLEQLDHVRIGKRIELHVEAGSVEEAQTQVDTACKKLLVNPIIEQYKVELKPIS